MQLSNSFHHLCIRVDGELFEVVAMFSANQMELANMFLEANPDCGMMDEDENGLIYICRHKASHKATPCA